MTLKSHALADVFPVLADADFDRLVDDIKTHGLRELITPQPDGSILDGRSRYRACLKAGVDPGFTSWENPDTAAAFIVSKNLVRRHLNTSQRAMVAAKLATFDQGRPTKKAPIGTIKINEAAQSLNVGKRTVQRARKVLENGTSEVVRRSSAAGTVGVDGLGERGAQLGAIQ